MSTREKVVFRLIYLFIAAFGSYLIMKDANWCFGDDCEFLQTTAIGKIEPMAYHMGCGRFVPLQHYDYNLLTLFSFGKSAWAHYSLVAISFMLITYFWAKICLLIYRRNIDSNKTGLLFSVLCFLSFLCSKPVVEVFLEVIFPERLVLLMLSAFIYLYLSTSNEKEWYKYFLAFCIVIYTSYVKEPVSGAFCSFALISLAFSYKNISRQKIIFFIAIILNFVIYLTLYYFLVFKTSTHFYNEGRCSLSYVSNIINIFNHNKILIAVFVLGIIRGIKILRSNDLKHLDFDSLLFMSISYTCAYFVLKLNESYYFTPSTFIGYIVIFYWISFYFHKNRVYSVVLSLICFCFIIFNCNGVLNKYKLINENRRTFIPTISKILEQYGKSLKIYGKDSGDFNGVILHWQKAVLNVVVNYLSKTEDQDYVSIIDNMDKLTSMNAIIISNQNISQDEKKLINDHFIHNNIIKVLHAGGLDFYLRR